MTIELTINGQARRYDGDEEQPLLWYLRDDLGLVGTRFGCGLGVCGACTVLLEDNAVRSCVLPMSATQGGRVTTIEGLGAGSLHPLQVAWIQNSVPQCGYCQSGQLMQAAALIKANPTPTDEDITGAMSGNLCRCGTYPRIHLAIKRAAAALVDGKPKT